MRRSLPLILVSAAVVAAVSILIWQTWLTFAPTPSKSTTRPTARSNDASSPTAPPKVVKRDPTGKIIKPGHDPNPDRLRSLDNPEPVKVKLSGVMKYKSPIHSNAPGRMPHKEGERTLAGPTLPPDPLLYSRLLNQRDSALVAWITTWEASIEEGTAEPNSMELRRAIGEDNLSLTQLYNLGRGIEFVSGNGLVSTLFYGQVVDRAETIAAESGGDATPSTFTHEQMEALRRLVRGVWEEPVQDFRLSVRVFRLLSRAEPEGSFERYRARKMVGEAYYAMGVNDSAALELAIQTYKEVAANPGIEVTPALEAEHQWMLSCVYGQAQKYESGLIHRRAAAEFEGQYYTVDARVRLIQELAYLNHREEALETWSRYRESIPSNRHEEVTAYLARLTPPPSSSE